MEPTLFPLQLEQERLEASLASQREAEREMLERRQRQYEEKQEKKAAEKRLREEEEEDERKRREVERKRKAEALKESNEKANAEQ